MLKGLLSLIESLVMGWDHGVLSHQRDVVAGNVGMGTSDDLILREPLLIQRSQHGQLVKRYGSGQDVVDHSFEVQT